jgi:acetyl-CoA acetyltransferase
MREVVVAGAGIHKFGRFPHLTIEEIGQEAVVSALKDAGLDWRKLEAAFCGTMHGGTAAGQRVLARIGLTGIPVVNVETACASGGTAVEMAFKAVACGQYDAVLALGVEKSDRGYLALNSYPMWEHLSGLGMPPVQLALTATRYMLDYGARQEHFAKVAVKSRRNGSLNPNAMHQKATTLERGMAARGAASPLTLMMLTTPCEGAAAVVITTKEIALRFNTHPVVIGAACAGVAKYGTNFCGMSAGFESDSVRVRNPEVTTVLSRQAYEAAGISPQDINLLECNDATTAGEMILIEELGFCAPGGAIKLVDEGRTEIAGGFAVNPSGGLLSMGEPVGAVGVAQVYETVMQLRGLAGPRQVPDAKAGMCQSAGAGGNSNVIILKR